MDWSKAKTIIIVALLITNIFMGSVYISESKTEMKERELAARSAVEYASSRGVSVKTELLVETKKMPVLFVSYDYDGQVENRTHKGIPVEASGDFAAEIVPESEGETSGQLITASAALIKLLDSRKDSIPAGLEITSVSLVYWVDTSLSGDFALEDTAIPSWKFETGEGSFYVEAFAE